MIPPEELISTLESILADQVVFISKLQSFVPGELTFDEIQELERDIIPAFDSMIEVIPSLVEIKPDPAIVGNKFVDAFDNLTVILGLLTELYLKRPDREPNG